MVTKMADNSKTLVQEAKTRKATKKAERELAQEAARLTHEEFVLDESNWEWVTIPTEDLFGKPYDGIIINLQKYGPGKHFVDPDLAAELKRIMEVRNESDLRVYRPQEDKKMKRMMALQGKSVDFLGTGPIGPSLGK
jgi:hypothetical protein